MSHRPPVGEVEGKRRQIEAMFDAIAPRYDLLNRLLSFGIDQWWRRKTIEVLQGAAPRRVLDAATGTGDLAIQAAERLQPETVVGVDIAEEMLRIGREKVRRRGLGDRVTLKSGDAADLPFSDDAVDAALVAFGVRNFEDLGAGLRELRRVVRPGGTLVVLEFSRPRAFPIKQLYGFYAHYVLPLIGQLLSGNREAYRYLPASTAVFPDGPDFMARMRQAGYRDVQWQPLTFGIASIYVGTVPGSEF